MLAILLTMAMVGTARGQTRRPVHDVAIWVTLQPPQVIAGDVAGAVVTVTNLGTQPEWVRVTGTVVKNGVPVWTVVRFVPVGVEGWNCLGCGQNQDLLIFDTQPGWLGPCLLQVGADLVASPGNPLPIFDDDASNNFVQVLFFVIPPPM